MTEKDLPEQPRDSQKCQNLDSKIAAWNGMGCNYCNGLMLHCRPDTHWRKLTIFYLAWSENRVFMKTGSFSCNLCCSLLVKCIVSFQPLCPPKNQKTHLSQKTRPSENQKPIWARKLAPPKSRFCIHLNQFTPTLKDALVTILCSEWIEFIMVGSHLYRAMSFHDTEHWA